MQSPYNTTPSVYDSSNLNWSQGPLPKLLTNKLFSNFQVELMVGRDKGKQGLVKQIVYERNWVFVEGLNNVSDL